MQDVGARSDRQIASMPQTNLKRTIAANTTYHFSSVFTREDTSSLPVPETKFEGSEGEGWGS